MRKIILLVGVAVALALAGGGVLAHRRAVALSAARDSLQTALVAAANATALSNALAVRAQHAEARADSTADRADSLAAVARVRHVQYVTLKATAPDTCAPVIAAADSALALAHAEAETARNGLRIAQEAANDYREGRDTALAALTRLRAAGDAVEHASRPSLAERLRPHLVVAAVAGLNPVTGRPDAVAGVGLGWSF